MNLLRQERETQRREEQQAAEEMKNALKEAQSLAAKELAKQENIMDTNDVVDAVEAGPDPVEAEHEKSAEAEHEKSAEAEHEKPAEAEHEKPAPRENLWQEVL